MTNLNLNSYLQPLGAPVTQVPSFSGYEFDMTNEVQGRFAILSNVNIKNFVQSTGTAAATGTFGVGSVLNITSASSPEPPHQYETNYTIPFIAIYEGTAAIATNQIFPALGHNISPGDYQVYGDMDWESTYKNVIYPTSSVWRGVIYNVAAGDVSIYLVSQWRFIQYNASLQS